MDALDLPIITEATNEYYRQIYADPDLGPIFKGINMVVLRTHVSYFIHQLTMFDQPLSARQLEYLRKVHAPVIAEHRVTTRHYDLMLGYLFDAMRANGADEEHLQKVQGKLLPLRDLFPPAHESEDGTVVVEHSPQGAGPADGEHGGDVAGKQGQQAPQPSRPSWLKRLKKALKSSTRGGCAGGSSRADHVRE